MNKNKKLYIGFSFFLIIISGLLLFCIFLVFKGNNNVNDDSVTTYLKYNNEKVSEIEIEKLESNVNTYDFSVIGFAVNENISYDIELVNPDKHDISINLLETNSVENNDETISKKIIDVNTVLFSDTILSGEVAYGKNFRLVINTNKLIKSNSNIKLKLIIK